MHYSLYKSNACIKIRIKIINSADYSVKNSANIMIKENEYFIRDIEYLINITFTDAILMSLTSSNF